MMLFVWVENTIRWLKSNKEKIKKAKDSSILKEIILGSSKEVRWSVVYSTILVILVFLPLLALSWIEGRLMTPLALSYIVALISSTIIALTLTVVLSYYLLPHRDIMEKKSHTFVVQWIRDISLPAIRWSLKFPKFGIILALSSILVTTILVITSWKEFLPPFNEWTLTIWISLPPGSSLLESNAVWEEIEKALIATSGVLSVARKKWESWRRWACKWCRNIWIRSGYWSKRK